MDARMLTSYCDAKVRAQLFRLVLLTVMELYGGLELCLKMTYFSFCKKEPSLKFWTFKMNILKYLILFQMSFINLNCFLKTTSLFESVFILQVYYVVSRDTALRKNLCIRRGLNHQSTRQRVRRMGRPLYKYFTNISILKKQYFRILKTGVLPSNVFDEIYLNLLLGIMIIGPRIEIK